VCSSDLGGKELSYCNIMDADATLQMIREFEEPTVVAVKHANPCGIGVGKDIFEAWTRAYEADTTSIFGGIVALNRRVDARTAKSMSKLFLEVIIAPGYDDEAVDILARKKNLRVLVLPEEGFKKVAPHWEIRKVVGGVLVQESDSRDFDFVDLKVVTKRQPTEEELEDLFFGWKVVKHVKSNAIVVVKDYQTVGVGAGQMNRVGSAKIAFAQGGDKCKGAVLASDAYFPMPDTVEEAAKAGITAIIQPGGSIKDGDSIEACDRLGIAMVFTGYRHFKH
jgi:phosphoribosylaminoimidazolecarboxamide formyltransferase/IMP cyclohydrolase